MNIEKGKKGFEQLVKEYDPLSDRMFQILDKDGKIANEKWSSEFTSEQIIQAYKNMLFARQADLMSLSYQRQGRMYTYPPNLGQEAISIAAAMVMKKDDWLVPAFRELGAWIFKGVRLRDIFLYWRGYEDGSLLSGTQNMMPSSVPISTQLPHAVGIGYAIKFKKEDSAVFTFFGDGGTSEGDFHESLNFAGVWKVPVVFIIQNNQYAISLPVKKQTASKNLAMKALAYGIKGIKVDGNDFLALYKTFREAAEYARSGNGPVLIECFTYRRSSHTTSDDPSLYRSAEEEKEWEQKDPVKRLKSYLVSRKLWKEEDEEALIDQYKKQIDSEFLEAENYPPYSLDDVFKYQYSDMPDDLKNQKLRYNRFLKWKEEQK